MDRDPNVIHQVLLERLDHLLRQVDVVTNASSSTVWAMRRVRYMPRAASTSAGTATPRPMMSTTRRLNRDTAMTFVRSVSRDRHSVNDLAGSSRTRYGGLARSKDTPPTRRKPATGRGVDSA